jgi:hypothetical protein
MTSQELIAAEYDRLKDMSLEKNRAYGDTALNPIGIFSTLSGSEAIRARLDDKLSRHKHAAGAFGESEVDDLIGYLVLLNIAERQERRRDQRVNEQLDWSKTVTGAMANWRANS